MNDGKKYQKPRLRDWGTVRELTAVGCTKPGGDAKGGSVNAPGLGIGSQGGCNF